MESRDTVKSAKRALEIFELFEKIRRPARLSEIAELLSYPQSSASVLMNSMKNLGYLNYDPIDHTYAPSLRVALLGGWLQFGHISRSQVLELLKTVRQKTGEATILSTRNGVHVQYVYTLDGAGPTRMGVKPGTLRPICRTPPGLLMLAQLTDAEIGKIVRRVNANAAECDREILADVLAAIEQARKDGYVAGLRLIDTGVASIALRLPFGDVFDTPLVVSVWGPAESVMARKDELVSMIRGVIADHYHPSNDIETQSESVIA
jgi:DNA-binding IclR family transcriptional regulator